jgi:hypothetical protein
MKKLPATERRDPASTRLDEMSVESILSLMNEEDRRVPESLAQIGVALRLLVEAWRSGGVGSTSAQGPAAVSPSLRRQNARPPSGRSLKRFSCCWPEVLPPRHALWR